jgi:hypothetical protein
MVYYELKIPPPLCEVDPAVFDAISAEVQPGRIIGQLSASPAVHGNFRLLAQPLTAALTERYAIPQERIDLSDFYISKSVAAPGAPFEADSRDWHLDGDYQLLITDVCPSEILSGTIPLADVEADELAELPWSSPYKKSIAREVGDYLLTVENDEQLLAGGAIISNPRPYTAYELTPRTFHRSSLNLLGRQACRTRCRLIPRFL